MPLLLFFFHLLLVYKIKKKTSLVKIILNDYDFNQAGAIIIIALFFTACDSCMDCFHTLAMSIDDRSHDVR